MTRKLSAFAIAAWMVSIGPAFADAPLVVVSIKPVHSLVAGVMDGIGEPKLLIEGGGSPHTYTLRPSEAQALQDADVVFWIGEDLESFLEKPLEALPRSGHVVALHEAEGVTLLPYRAGGAWAKHADEHHEAHADEHHEAHADEHHGEHADEHHGEHADEHHGEHADEHHAEHADEHHAEHADEHHAEHADEHHEKGDAHAHAHGETDMHIWLDPANATAMVTHIVANLSAADPANASRYEANGAAVTQRLADLETQLKDDLAPIREHPYIVFHDAYQYFEDHYGLKPAGSITVSPERRPSAAKLSEIREKIVSTGAACVFSEPQFEPAVVSTVIEGTEARTGVLDPLGADLQPGSDAYFVLMHNLAASLKGCLTPQS